MLSAAGTLRRSRQCVGVATLVCAVAASACTAEGLPGKAASSSCLTVLSQRDLSGKASWVGDVRWGDQTSAYVTAQFYGALKVSLPPTTADEAEVVWPRGDSRRQIWLPQWIARSGNTLALAAPVFSYGWKQLGGETSEQIHAVDTIGDLDVFEDQVLLFATARDAEGRYAPDGVVARLGPLTAEPEDLTPVFIARSGPGALEIDSCLPMWFASVRFLANGSFIIVPGSEPDVYHYDPQGKLLATWSSEVVGYDSDCKISAEEKSRLAADEPARWVWVNQRRMVDEILPLPDGPGLVVRSVKNGKTSWQLKLLRPGGKVESCEIPIVADSTLAHLRGDVRGDEVLLLLSVYGFRPGKQLFPEIPPKLLTLRYKP